MSGAWSNDQLNSLYIYSATTGNLILVVNSNGLGIYSSATGALLMGVTGAGMVLNAPNRQYRMDASAFTVSAVPDTGSYIKLTTAPTFGGVEFIQPENSAIVGNAFVPASIFADAIETLTDSRPHLELISPVIDQTPDLHAAQLLLHGQALLSAADDSFIECAASATQINGNLNLGSAAVVPEDQIGSTTNGTTASATFVNTLTTTGIHGTSFVVPPSGSVMVIATATGSNNTAGSFAIMDWEIRIGGTPGSGVVWRAANENTAAVVQSGTANNQAPMCSMGIATGLTAGSTYNACLVYHTGSGGTAQYNRRHIIVVPMGNA